ncbi:methionine--tRNA ligase [candidate division KSB1 bacterium 4484_87]|nr:MAG: methionine--tRNA ligase [candidate division KSB1 bacterium 4484_87]
MVLESKQRILVTSALPYANGPIHLGHLAGAYLPADIFVRYHRLKGSDVIYICGSDEHGVPIMLRARAEGVSPQDIVDRYHELNKKSFAAFGMSFDFYGRTSSPVHHRTSQDFFRRLNEKNIFIVKKEKQLYDPEAKIFLADRFVRGTCPKCGYEDAYGDQCEKCGSSLSPADLIDPRSAITNAEPVMKETVHWYLPLARFQKKLEKWINEHQDWKPNVLGQIKSWFADGLKDRAVTRDLPWGVSIPEDIAREHGIDASGKVLYVWFDAPIGYISATIEWAEEKGDPDLWKAYWQDQSTRLIHFIGKDNIVFHCIIFPAMLMEHGDYVLPENVPANEFLNLEGNKLSTSRNYAVWLDDYLQKFEPDSLRYVLAGNLPETRDADFSWKDFQARHNNELADILGNFVNRTVTFAHKYFSGKVPPLGELDEMDRQLVEKIKTYPSRLGELIEKYQFKNYIREFMDLARFANKYFNDKEPWKTRKENPQACATTINLCLQTAKTLSIVAEPVLPFTARRIWKMLNVENSQTWDDATKLTLDDGAEIQPAEILFTKIEDDVIQKEIERLQQAGAPNEQKAVEKKETEMERISFDDFKKVELRVATILEAKKVEKADKLLQLQIDLGEEKRQIVAGIAQHYSPEELVGKRIIVVANLEPAKIRGVESNGMLLAASDSEGNLTLLTVDNEIANGSKIS